MVEPSSGNEEEKNVGRANSFTKFLRSPARTNSKKTSSNPFTKLLFRRKTTRKNETENEGDKNDGKKEDEEKDSSLVEPTKDIIEDVIEEVLHRKKDAPIEQVKDTKPVAESKESSSDEAKEHKTDLADKVKEGIKQANEGFEKGLKEEVTLQVKSADDQALEITEKKAVEVIKAPNLAQRFKEEESTIESKKEETSQEECKVKEEDNCVSSLAQGLQNICAPWSTKKDD